MTPYAAALEPDLQLAVLLTRVACFHTQRFAASKGYLRSVGAVHSRSAGPPLVKEDERWSCGSCHAGCQTLTLKFRKLEIESGGLELGTR